MFEPVTALTDFLLAGVSVILGWRLFQSGQLTQHESKQYWGVAFMCIALAALLGGISHGFISPLYPVLKLSNWRATLIYIGLANFCFSAGAISAVLYNRWRQIMLSASVSMAAVYVLAMAFAYDFRVVMAHYAVCMSMTIVLCVQIRSGRTWLQGGFWLSIGATLLWQLRWPSCVYFNFNDLFHVLQIIAIYLIYRGCMRL